MKHRHAPIRTGVRGPRGCARVRDRRTTKHSIAARVLDPDRLSRVAQLGACCEHSRDVERPISITRSEGDELCDDDSAGERTELVAGGECEEEARRGRVVVDLDSAEIHRLLSGVAELKACMSQLYEHEYKRMHAHTRSLRDNLICTYDRDIDIEFSLVLKLSLCLRIRI